MTFAGVGNPRRPVRLRLTTMAWIVCFGAVALHAPVVADSTSDAASAAETSARGAARIRELIGDARCTVDADCHTVGIGALACGGPENYAAWSSAVTAPKALDGLVRTHRAARVRELAAQGAESTCAITPDPGATCAITPDPGATCVRSASSGPGQCQLRRRGATQSTI